MPKDVVRATALSVLVQLDAVEKRRTLKLSELLNQAMAQGAWTSTARGQVQTLVYGVIRYWVVLEALMEALSHFPLRKLQPEVRTLLRLGLYQLRYMPHVPDYAAVNTTVSLARMRRLSPKSVSFLNGMLRTYQRQHAEAADGVSPVVEIPSLDADPKAHLSLTYAWPEWFCARLLKQYSLPEIQTMGEAYLSHGPMTLHVNTLRTSVEAFVEHLQGEKIPCQQDPPGSGSVLLEAFVGTPTQLPGYGEGWFTVQDPSSALVAQWVAPLPGETVVDLCAAPGMKTANLAARMENQGAVFAVDPAEKRMQRLVENMDRLGVQCVHPVVGEAQDFELPSTHPLADRVLVDAPCSGVGTLRKHPEILLQRDLTQMERYPARQLALLEKGASLLKPDGILVYSTCSMDREENQAVVAAFLSAHPRWRLLAEEQRLMTKAYDGFYLARLQAPSGS